MKDENIKEILEDVKRHLDYVKATKQASIRDNEMKAMYDYITNLQTIEREYSAILSENAELENKITNLQDRIDKSIEYIEKSNKHFKENYNEPYEYAFMVNADEIMKILKGKSDE